MRTLLLYRVLLDAYLLGYWDWLLSFQHKYWWGRASGKKERKTNIYLCGKRRSSAMFTITETVVQQEGESMLINRLEQDLKRTSDSNEMLLLRVYDYSFTFKVARWDSCIRSTIRNDWQWEDLTNLESRLFHHSELILWEETARGAGHSSSSHHSWFSAGSGKALLHQLTWSTSLEGFLPS